MKLAKKILGFVSSGLLALSVISPQVVTTVLADDEPSLRPQTSKTLESNGDGTYKLSLSVTGAVETSTETNKANVIIVVDTSGSMDEETSTTTYQAHPTGRYGEGRITLYRERGLIFTWYDDIENDNYSGTVYYRDSSGTYREYTGTRYADVTTYSDRMTVAKDAVNDLLGTLAQNNMGDVSDMVEVSLISFASESQTLQTRQTGNLSAITNSVNGLSAYGGTNWDDALYDAIALANANTDGDPTYIIFVSDGNPTYYMNADHTQRRGNGQEQTNNIRDSYNAAATEAGRIANANYRFYGIGVFGNVTRMQNLATAAGGTYYSATDGTALENAFSSIASVITNNVGFTDVKFTDGISAGTSATVLDLEADVTDFRYTITGGGNSYSIVLDENGNIATINGGTASVTLTDSVGQTRTLSVGSAFPAASANDDTATIEWDLSSLGTLLNNYTYTVDFDVWPNQVAYDTVAALNNGSLSWDEVDQSSYTRSDTQPYTYGLKTNTTASVDYTVDGQSYNADVTNPDAIALTSSTMTVRKDWDGATPDANASVTLELYIDGVASGVTRTLSQTTNWVAEFSIAPGMIVNGETKEAGHDYTLVETNVVGVDEWDYIFESATEHPMLVNGTLSFTADDNELVATNHKKSDITISKIVTNRTNFTLDADQLFYFDVTIDALGDNELDAYVTATSGIVSESRTSDLSIASDGHYTITSDGTYRFALKADEQIYIDGLVEDTVVQVEEVNIPDGYTLEDVTIGGATEGSMSVANQVATTTAAWNESYTVGFGNYYDVVEVTPSFTKRVEGNDATETFEIVLLDSTRTQIDQVTTSLLNDGEQESKDFETLTFNQVGVYNYYIQETTTTTVPGWTYDNSEHLVQITVTKDNNNKLVATVSGNNPTITNQYNYVPNSGVISVTKVLDQLQDGLTLPDITGAYTFVLTDENQIEIGRVTNPTATGGTVSFAPISYTTPGTYTYYVTESGSVTDVENDSTPTKQVTVTVSANPDNSLSVTNASVTFTNTYTYTTVSANLQAKKTYTTQSGTTPPDITGRYLFTLSAVTANAPLPSTTSLSNPEDGEMNFGEVTFTSEGTYVYEVTESQTVSGVINDPTPTKQITVVVEKVNGRLAVTSINTVEFENVYRVSPVTVDIPLVKIIEIPNGLEGVTPDVDGKFMFALDPVTANAPLPAIADITYDQSASVQSFTGITFTTTGTYEYTVTESGTLDYISNDPVATKTIEIVVSDDGEGHLVANVNAGQTVTFTNTFQTVSNVEFEIYGTKRVIVGEPEDDDSGDTGDGGIYGLVEEPNGQEPEQNGEDAGDEQSEPTPTPEVTAEPTVEPTIEPTVEPTAEPTAEPTVEPIEGEESGEDNNEDEIGFLSSFMNQFFIRVNAAPDPIITEIGEGQFSFEVFYDDGESTGIIGETLYGPNSEAIIEFEPISYTTDELLALVQSGKASRDTNGNYYINYVVKEINVPAGYTAGTTQQNVTVMISRDAQGRWNTVVDYGQSNLGVTFTNYYNTNEVEIEINATKSLTGRTLRDGEFSFTIEGDGPLPAQTTVTNGADGSIEFGTIKFTRVDLGNDTEREFTYTIKEVEGSLPNVFYDTDELTFTITVTDDGAGGLTAVYDSDDVLAFMNNFETETEVVIEVYKQLDGEAPEDGQFTFELYDVSGQLINTVANDEYGSVIFDGLVFDQDDVGFTYVYEIREVVPTVKNYIYDLDPIRVEITIGLDENTDELTATATYSREGFENESKNVIVIDPPVTKVLTGDTPQTAETFVFKLTGSEGTQLTTHIVGQGTEEFGNITLTEAGVYTFTIEEVVGSAKGYTYDTEVYTKTVTVTEDASGYLSATEVITKADGTEVSEVVFTNNYEGEKPTPTPTPPYHVPDTSDATNFLRWGMSALVAGVVAVWATKKLRD